MGEEELAVEFGTVASWTADAVDELGPEYAIVAGCRGSGDPALLHWLARACRIGPGTSFVDVGAGVGGASAWAAQTYGVRPVLVEPMEEACRSARRMFELPTVCAAGEQLPFTDDRFDVVWCVGVLCTVHEKADLLRELRRVLTPGGSLGMMVLVAEPSLHSEVPHGNEFPREDELVRLIDDAGFVLRELVEAPIDSAPTEWTRQADRVDELLEKVHGSDERWLAAQEQAGKMSHLLSTRQVTRRLVHATNSVGGVS